MVTSVVTILQVVASVSSPDVTSAERAPLSAAGCGDGLAGDNVDGGAYVAGCGGVD